MTRYLQIKTCIAEKAKACGRHPNEIELVVVSKDRSIEAIRSVYEEGARDFGERRVQEVLHKIPELPADCRWHMIGTLQSNKIAKAISSFCLIHSVDTAALACQISEASEKKGVVTPILLQVNTSKEKSKHGLYMEEWQEKLEEVNQLTHVQIQGLMTIAPLTEDPDAIRRCFRKLHECREKWRGQMKDPDIFQHLSMGMSQDFPIAIEEGATLLRIGTAVF